MVSEGEAGNKSKTFRGAFLQHLAEAVRERMKRQESDRSQTATTDGDEEDKEAVHDEDRRLSTSAMRWLHE